MRSMMGQQNGAARACFYVGSVLVLKLTLCETQQRALLVRDVHLGIAAGRGGVHGGGDDVEVQSNTRPLRSAQHHKGYSAARKVLLIAHILVGGEKYVETGPLRRCQQVAVGQRIPSPVLGLCNGVARKEPGNAARRYMVKKNEHPRVCLQWER